MLANCCEGTVSKYAPLILAYATRKGHERGEAIADRVVSELEQLEASRRLPDCPNKVDGVAIELAKRACKA